MHAIIPSVHKCWKNTVSENWSVPFFIAKWFENTDFYWEFSRFFWGRCFKTLWILGTILVILLFPMNSIVNVWCLLFSIESIMYNPYFVDNPELCWVLDLDYICKLIKQICCDIVGGGYYSSCKVFLIWVLKLPKLNLSMKKRTIILY